MKTSLVRLAFNPFLLGTALQVHETRLSGTYQFCHSLKASGKMIVLVFGIRIYIPVSVALFTPDDIVSRNLRSCAAFTVDFRRSAEAALWALMVASDIPYLK